jgi:hypothetical protein
MLGRLQKWLQDQRGTYELVQFALILPVFVIFLYGSFELLKLVSIRQSLDAGTYQAARYLSVYHKTYYDSGYNRPTQDDRLQAERLIWQSLLASPFMSEDTPMYVAIRYFDGANRELSSLANFDSACSHIQESVRNNDPNLILTVRSQITLPWKGTVLGLSLGNVTISSAHTVYVDCGPWYPWPVETPQPTPTRAMGSG